MNILLVNDDGYDAQGIRLVLKKLQKYGNVTIVAPKGVASAKSCSLTLHDGLSLKEEEKDIYSLTGFPVDCVAFALHELKKDFDLVVSGCNHGLNISYDTLYSGTIGACVEALKNKKKAIAFSCEFNFELVDKYFDKVMNYILENNLISDNYFLNINFPKGEIVEDIKLSKLYYREDKSYYVQDEQGLYWTKRKEMEDIKDKDTDCYMVNNKIVSITPMTGTFFNENIYNQLKPLTNTD